jgi:hypothetical protein
MEQRRSSKRVRTILAGRIVFNNRFSTIECTVRDLSETGARIYFPHPINIPPEFDLEIPKRGLSVRAREMWCNGKEHGVMFLEPAMDGLPGRSTAGPARPAVSGPLQIRVDEILNEARRKIAQTIGISEDNVRLDLDIKM